MISRSLVLPVLAAASLAQMPSARAEIKACKTGSIIAGNPKVGGPARPPASGGNAKSDPPLAVRSMVFKGNTMYTTNGDSIWSIDLASGALKKIAGEEHKGPPKFNDGSCAEARLQNIHGMTMLPDGSLVAADFPASALVKITSPGDPAQCRVSYHAGTDKPTQGNATNVGDDDGPVGTAKLNWPEWPVADAAGNVYFIDSQTSKLRKVAPDRTVSTIASLPSNGPQTYRGLTLLKDKIYAVSNGSTTGIVTEIDPKNGKVRKVFEGGYKQFVEIPQNTAPALMAITNDGTNLFVTGSGYIWKLSTAGKLTHVAGKGSPTDIPRTYDLKAPHPAKDLLLRIRNGDSSTMGTLAALTYHEGNLYFRGREDGVYVVKIDCK